MDKTHQTLSTEMQDKLQEVIRKLKKSNRKFNNKHKDQLGRDGIRRKGSRELLSYNFLLGIFEAMSVEGGVATFEGRTVNMDTKPD